MHAQQHSITIAVNANRSHMQRVPAALAFLPQALPRSAEKRCATRPKGCIPCVAIHVRNHEHLGRRVVLHHSGDQTVGTELRLPWITHKRTSTP
jgi:hypothetical protein